VSYVQSRQTLQKIATTKVDDAWFLFNNGRFSNAYYLAGYAIEIGLKACIVRQIVNDTMPDKKLILDAYTHDFERLVGAAGLRGELKAEQDRDGLFHTNWGIASQWDPASRYDVCEKSTAQFLVNAVVHPDHGVLQWIKKFW
jgi:HEPN domain-containing protein